MLLYITVGESGPEGPREFSPPEGLPLTVSAHFDRGMRHHARPAALQHWSGDALEEIPDWKLDRLVIRIGLFWSERLRVETGDRVAILGTLGPLWPLAEFAALGLGAVPVVFEGEPSDTALARGLSETAPRVVVATDREAARQLMRLRTSGIPLVVPDGTEPVDPAALTLGTLLDLAAALDTAERAGWFRQRSRSVDPDSEACWHVSRDGAIARLAHRDVMGLVATRLASAPLLPGDVVYLESPRIALAARIALYSLVGDGRAVTTLGRDGQLDGDLAAVRPHGLLATSLSLARLWQEVRAGQEGEGGRLGRLLPSAWPRRPMRGLRKALRAKLGDRLRLVEAVGPVAADIAAWLGRSGITLTSTGDSKEVNA